jgi:hypothetical protein
MGNTLGGGGGMTSPHIQGYGVEQLKFDWLVRFDDKTYVCYYTDSDYAIQLRRCLHDLIKNLDPAQHYDYILRYAKIRTGDTTSMKILTDIVAKKLGISVIMRKRGE